MAQLPLFPTKNNDLMMMQTKWKSILDPLLATSSAPAASQGFIGEVRPAFVTEKQFQSQAGTGWILCDGRSVVGSPYQALTGNNSIPDMRGLGIRGKNNGRTDGKQDPTGEQPLGTYEADTTAVNGLHDTGHTHSSPFSSGYVGWQTGGNAGSVAAAQVGGIPMPLQNVIPSGNATLSGDTETRAKAIILNYFIRIF